ncbi:F-box domain-containing protein [Mycena sanguinolenta]|uniref:F-box domain-containing protein n=1 Tax=Mycena sanguinolenta TaxID=230812 RepID=A0A8H7D2Y7_9AGAR|nr:F-box domain-containing protein [Mycena sanguinolenta]
MDTTLFPMRTILAQQIERTKGRASSEIKQLIAESDSRVTSLRNEITALESQIAALVERRDRECAVGDALRSLIAPIRILPAELLAEIFVLTIRDPSDEPKLVWRNLSHIQDVYRVSHVSCHWRQIATGLTRLWTGPLEVTFYRRSGGQTGKENYVQGLRAWLARSAPLAVSIYIRSPINGLDQIEFGSRLAEELVHVAHRTRSLRFINRTSGWLAQRLAGRKWDALEELELGAVASDDDPDVHFDCSNILSFATAPRLRKLTIDLTSRTPMPWAQLTDITMLKPILPEIFRDIFSQCKNVVRIGVLVRDWPVPSPPQTAVIALDHLHVLDVHWVGNTVHEMVFLDSLSAPALDDLSLNFHFNSGIEWAEVKLTAFQRRSPNITKLKIKGNAFVLPSGALIAALRNAPALTRLSIDFIDGDFLSALYYADDDDAEPLVPCLHSLTLAKIYGTLSQRGSRGYDCIAMVDGCRAGVALEGTRSCALDTNKIEG